MSELENQLGRLKTLFPDVETPKNIAGEDLKETFLFDAKAAKKITSDFIHRIGVDGIEELIQLDGRFREFLPNLFHKSWIHSSREQRKIDENDEINRLIGKLMRLLSPYFLLKASHKVIEFLIRHYRIYMYNVDEIMECILPYHDNLLFSRLIQIMRIASTKWFFLEPLQFSGAHLSRKELLMKAEQDPSILDFICRTTKRFVDEEIENANWTSFYSVFVLEFLGKFSMATLSRTSSNLSFDNILKRILSQLVEGLKCDSNSSYRIGNVMILTLVCSISQLRYGVLEAFVKCLVDDYMTKILKGNAEYHSLLALVFIMQSQENMDTLPKPFCNTLLKMKNFEKTLNQIAEKGYAVDNFMLGIMKPMLEDAYKNEDDSQIVHYLLDLVVPLEISSIIPSLTIKCLDVLVPYFTNDNEEQQKADKGKVEVISRIIAFLEQLFPEEMRKGVDLGTKIHQGSLTNVKKEEIPVKLLKFVENSCINYNKDDKKDAHAKNEPKIKIIEKIKAEKEEGSSNFESETNKSLIKLFLEEEKRLLGIAQSQEKLKKPAKNQSNKLSVIFDKKSSNLIKENIKNLLNTSNQKKGVFLTIEQKALIEYTLETYFTLSNDNIAEVFNKNDELFEILLGFISIVQKIPYSHDTRTTNTFLKKITEFEKKFEKQNESKNSKMETEDSDSSSDSSDSDSDLPDDDEGETEKIQKMMKEWKKIEQQLEKNSNVKFFIPAKIIICKKITPEFINSLNPDKRLKLLSKIIRIVSFEKELNVELISGINRIIKSIEMSSEELFEVFAPEIEEFESVSAPKTQKNQNNQSEKKKRMFEKQIGSKMTGFVSICETLVKVDAEKLKNKEKLAKRVMQWIPLSMETKFKLSVIQKGTTMEYVLILMLSILDHICSSFLNEISSKMEIEDENHSKLQKTVEDSFNIDVLISNCLINPEITQEIRNVCLNLIGIIAKIAPNNLMKNIYQFLSLAEDSVLNLDQNKTKNKISYEGDSIGIEMIEGVLLQLLGSLLEREKQMQREDETVKSSQIIRLITETLIFVKNPNKRKQMFHCLVEKIGKTNLFKPVIVTISKFVDLTIRDEEASSKNALLMLEQQKQAENETKMDVSDSENEEKLSKIEKLESELSIFNQNLVLYKEQTKELFQFCCQIFCEYDPFTLVQNMQILIKFLFDINFSDKESSFSEYYDQNKKDSRHILEMTNAALAFCVSPFQNDKFIDSVLNQTEIESIFVSILETLVHIITNFVKSKKQKKKSMMSSLKSQKLENSSENMKGFEQLTTILTEAENLFEKTQQLLEGGSYVILMKSLFKDSDLQIRLKALEKCNVKIADFSERNTKLLKKSAEDFVSLLEIHLELLNSFKTDKKNEKYSNFEKNSWLQMTVVNIEQIARRFARIPDPKSQKLEEDDETEPVLIINSKAQALLLKIMPFLLELLIFNSQDVENSDKNESNSIWLASSVALCIATIAKELGMSVLAFVPKIFKNLISTIQISILKLKEEEKQPQNETIAKNLSWIETFLELDEGSEENEPENEEKSETSTKSKTSGSAIDKIHHLALLQALDLLIKTFPKFTSPYISDFIKILIHSSTIRAIHDRNSKKISYYCDSILATVSYSLETRLFLTPLLSSLPTAIWFGRRSVVQLLKIVQQFLQNLKDFGQIAQIDQFANFFCQVLDLKRHISELFSNFVKENEENLGKKKVSEKILSKLSKKSTNFFDFSDISGIDDCFKEIESSALLTIETFFSKLTTFAQIKQALAVFIQFSRETNSEILKSDGKSLPAPKSDENLEIDDEIAQIELELPNNDRVFAFHRVISAIMDSKKEEFIQYWSFFFEALPQDLNRTLPLEEEQDVEEEYNFSSSSEDENESKIEAKPSKKRKREDAFPQKQEKTNKNPISNDLNSFKSRYSVFQKQKLLILIFQNLATFFRLDTKGFMQDPTTSNARFDLISEPLAMQLENTFLGNDKSAQEEKDLYLDRCKFLAPVWGHFANSIQYTMWASLQKPILDCLEKFTTEARNPLVVESTLLCLASIFETVGENYAINIPKINPYLGAVLETYQNNARVVDLAFNKLNSTVKETTGEDLIRYLKK